MVYDLNTVAHAAGTAKTHDVAAMTLANIKFVRTTAEAYRAANAGDTTLKASTHMDELIAVCNAEQQKLEAVAEALHRNGGLIASTDQDGGSLFTGYVV
ncbi:hypothetical protein [Tsukamurella sp. 1534]|uniref:hypothetical protein n=1 Tax=Tsukamurella sp. 1534 TaxID=1151061 RepID=UPI00031848A7|nr:hypothetical protein [Tsukamurella sp. 1534]